MESAGILQKCSCYIARAFGYSADRLRQTPWVGNKLEVPRFLYAYFYLSQGTDGVIRKANK